jgi:hypothetical protein
MAVCNATAQANLAVSAAEKKRAVLCKIIADYDACYVTYGGECSAEQRMPFEESTRAMRNLIRNDFGYDCSGVDAAPMILSSGVAVTTTSTGLQASSGDSGSASSASSGSAKVWGSVGSSSLGSSTSAMTIWQWVLLTCLICTCCCAAGGGAAYVATNKKGKKRTGRMNREEYDYEEQMEPEPLEQYSEYVDPDAPPVAGAYTMAPAQVVEAVQPIIPAAVPVVTAEPISEIDRMYMYGQMQPMLQPQVLETIPTASMTASGEASQFTPYSGSYYTQAPASLYLPQPLDQSSVYYSAAQPQYATTTSYMASPAYATPGGVI